jgi:hypothetical protein
MKRLSPLLFVIFCGCLWLLVSCAQNNQPPPSSPLKPMQVIWAGTSDGFPIRWTTKEISVTSNPPSKARPVAFSDTGLTILDFSQAGSTQTTNCDFERTSSILSVVGPWLSLQHVDEMRCGSAEATRQTQALAIDLTHPAKRPELTDIFPEHAVLLALLQAPPLSHTLAALHAAPPRTTAALVALLAAANAVCGSAFPKDFLNRFAFERVRGTLVLVRLGLPMSCKASEVLAWLPVPPADVRAFQLAAKGRQGFLLADQPAIARQRATTILYHLRTSGGGS